MFNRITSAAIVAMLMLAAVSCQSQTKKPTITVGKVTTKPCPIDTIKGLLYHSGEFGNSWIDTGYCIAYCGGLQIGATPYWDGKKVVKYPTWIPGRYLRNDEVDEKGNLKYKDWQWQFSSAKFTDNHFKPVNITSVYGLLVLSK